MNRHWVSLKKNVLTSYGKISSTKLE